MTTPIRGSSPRRENPSTNLQRIRDLHNNPGDVAVKRFSHCCLALAVEDDGIVRFISDMSENEPRRWLKHVTRIRDHSSLPYNGRLAEPSEAYQVLCVKTKEPLRHRRGAIFISLIDLELE